MPYMFLTARPTVSNYLTGVNKARAQENPTLTDFLAQRRSALKPQLNHREHNSNPRFSGSPGG